MSKRIAAALLLSAIVAQPVFADFGRVTRALERKLGFSRTWIPFLGLARTIIRASHPKGIHDLQLAVYEGRRTDVPGKDVEEILRTTVDKGYSPLVKAYSRKSGEWSFIYARPAKSGAIELFIVAHDKSDTVVVRVVADAETVGREFGTPQQMAHIGRR